VDMHSVGHCVRWEALATGTELDDMGLSIEVAIGSEMVE